MTSKQFEELIEKNRLYKHLNPTILPNKLKHINDLNNLIDSFVGRIDILFLNSFIMESEKLILNSISLFEQGYFDNACYSLRQALELANNMAYFSELSDVERKIEFKNWGLNEKLEASKVMSYLNSYADNYKEIKLAFKGYFEKIKKTKESLNTVVHKQGFNTFYLNDSTNSNDRYVTNDIFIDYLKTVIGAVAILRLTIDPFPILLQDEEIYFRVPDLLTESYSFDFIDTYIGRDYIEKYTLTNIYTSYYRDIVNHEKMSESVAQIIKWQFIDRNDVEQILKQVHLLSGYDLVALSISLSSKKISKVYMMDSLLWYTTETESKNKGIGFSSNEIQSYKSSSNTYNKDYNAAYMSYITHEKTKELSEMNMDFSVYIEHNEKLSKGEIFLLENQYKELTDKFSLQISNII